MRFVLGKDDPKRRCFCRYLSVIAAYLRLPVPEVVLTSDLQRANEWAEQHVLTPLKNRREALERETERAKNRLAKLQEFIAAETKDLEHFVEINQGRKGNKSQKPLGKYSYDHLKTFLERVYADSQRVKEVDAGGFRVAVGVDTETGGVRSGIGSVVLSLMIVVLCDGVMFVKTMSFYMTYVTGCLFSRRKELFPPSFN